MTLLDALDALHALPPDTNPIEFARIAQRLIGGLRTSCFTLAGENEISCTGINQDGHTVTRPRPTAADLLPYYVGADKADGLAPLYDLEPGPWISLRLDAGRPRGALIVDGLATPPTDEEIRTWRAFAAALGHRIALAGELRAAQHRAETDPLTGAAVRDVAIDAILQAKDDRRPITVIFIDLDGFKAINDTQGHDAGDRILIQTVRTLRGVCRQSDLIARYGGDEFIIVSDVSPELLIPRLDSALHHAGIAASLGSARSPEHGFTPEEMLAAADRSMYDTKRARKAQSATNAPAPDLQPT